MAHAGRPEGTCTSVPTNQRPNTTSRRLALQSPSAVTSTPLALRALAIVTRDGQVDSVRHLRAPDDMNEAADERRLVLWLAWEQPGRYDLAIHVNGYAVWRRTGVVVQ